MNPDSHEQNDAPEAALENEPLVEPEEEEDAEESGVSASGERDEWAEEFSPEELVELFGGEEKVPAQVLEARPEVEVLEFEDEPESEEEGAGERLQKLLARTGVASRRAAEELIRAGRVSVNNEIVTELGRRARAGRDRIAVDGKTLKVPGVGSTVVVLHKPRGCVSTKSDPQGRTTVMAFLPKRLAHLHPVGRLDFDTSGLLLLTDDGDLTNLLLHPSHGVDKRYHARVRGVVSTSTLDQLQKGVRLEDGVTLPCRVRVKAQTPSNALLEIVLREGRNRQVRRMLQAVGHPISALRRVRVGPLDLGGLPAGAFRELIPAEVHQLKKAALAPKSALKTARPFAYKPRPSKAEDKTLPQVLGRRPARPSQSPENSPEPHSRPSDQGPPRERTERPPVSRDNASRDGSSAGSTARPNNSRPNAPRDASPRSGAPCDGASRERSARPSAAREDASREGSSRSGSGKRSARPYAPRESAPREGSRPRDSRQGAPSERGSNEGARGGTFNRGAEGRRTDQAQGERPYSRPTRPNPRPAARDERGREERGQENRGEPRSGGAQEGTRRPSTRPASAGAPRANAERAPQSRAPQERASAPRSDSRPARSERAPGRASAPRASAEASKPSETRAPGASRAGGAKQGGANARGGSKLAKKIEDRWK